MMKSGKRHRTLNGEGCRGDVKDRVTGQTHSLSRVRIVDLMEELVRFTVLLSPHTALLVDRYSKRKEVGVPIDAATDLSSIATAS